MSANSRAPLYAAQWWARLVGAPQVHPYNTKLTIRPEKIEDLREAGAPS